MCDVSTAKAEEGASGWRDCVERLADGLSSSVAAMLDHAVALTAEADSIASHDTRADAERTLEAARQLEALVSGLLSGASDTDGESVSARASRWRHDLRTPVNAIKGYAEIILEDHQHEDAAAGLRDTVGRLVSESARLLDLVAHLRGGEFDRYRQDSPLPGPALARTAGENAVQDAPEVESAKILVVDDNEANRDYLARRLERDGHAVTTTASGARSLALVTANDFDLVLLDLVMPEMDGFEVLTRLKAGERSRDIPVVMISGSDTIADVARCIEHGAEDYLTKPFNQVLLKARIAAGLERGRWRKREREFLRQVESEKRRSEQLLLSILPRGIVDRLAVGEQLIADRFEEVTVLFSDIVGFTRLAAEISAPRLVEILNCLFSEFDALASDLGAEKIKTVGDAYMAAVGLPEPRSDHAQAAAAMALEMFDALARVNANLDVGLEMRVGLHSGPLIAGVIGTDKFAYDLWGTTVNIASRMESYSEPGRVHLSANTAASLATEFKIESRGLRPIRGMGEVETFFLGPRLNHPR